MKPSRNFATDSNEYEIFQEWRWRYPPGVTRNTEHVFGLVAPSPLPVRIEPREHLSYLWMPWQEAAEKVFSWTNAEAIRRLPEVEGTSEPKNRF